MKCFVLMWLFWREGGDSFTPPLGLLPTKTLFPTLALYCEKQSDGAGSGAHAGLSDGDAGLAFGVSVRNPAYDEAAGTGVRPREVPAACQTVSAVVGRKWGCFCCSLTEKALFGKNKGLRSCTGIQDKPRGGLGSREAPAHNPA